jgi:hypothetical protein
MRHITPWALLLFAAALLAAPVAALETEAYSDSESSLLSYNIPFQSYDISAGWLTKFKIYKIEDSTGPFTLASNRNIAQGTYGGWIGRKSGSPYSNVSSVTFVDASDPSIVYGTGTVGYNTNFDAEGNAVAYSYWVDASNWTNKNQVGTHTILLSGDEYVPELYSTSKGYIKTPSAVPVYFQFGGYNDMGYCVLDSEKVWMNTISFEHIDDTPLGPRSQINLYRCFAGINYSSRIVIDDPAGYTHIDDISNADASYVVIGNITTHVYSSSVDRWYNRSWYSEEPEPTPGGGNFALSLSTNTAAVGDPVTATLTPPADAPAYDMVEWTIADDWRPYRLTTGTWYAYNATTETYADAVTEAAVLSQTCQFIREGNGPVFCRVYDLANGTLLADLKEYVTVSGTSALKFPLYVAVFDADTGATLMSTTCQITDLDTSEVSTTTIQTSRAGETFLLDSSDRYQIVVSKTGYESRTWTNIRSDTSSLTAYLPKTAGGPTDIYIYFSVHDTGGAPVPNALVSLSGLTPTLTNSQGSVKLLAATNTTYTYTVTADGYLGATDTLETSATSLWYECTLTPSGGAATTIPTTAIPGGSSENLDDAMAIWTDNLQLIAALLFMAFIIGILKLMV